MKQTTKKDYTYLSHIISKPSVKYVTVKQGEGEKLLYNGNYSLFTSNLSIILKLHRFQKISLHGTSHKSIYDLKIKRCTLRVERLDIKKVIINETPAQV